MQLLRGQVTKNSKPENIRAVATPTATVRKYFSNLLYWIRTLKELRSPLRLNVDLYCFWPFVWVSKHEISLKLSFGKFIVNLMYWGKACKLKSQSNHPLFMKNKPILKLSVYRTVCPSTCLSVHPFFCPSVLLLVHPSICPSVHLFICLSIHLFIHPRVRPSIRPSVHLSVRLSVRPSYLHLYIHM
jgi:hypothetical protein